MPGAPNAQPVKTFFCPADIVPPVVKWGPYYYAAGSYHVNGGPVSWWYAWPEHGMRLTFFGSSFLARGLDSCALLSSVSPTSRRVPGVSTDRVVSAQASFAPHYPAIRRGIVSILQ